MEVTPQLKSKLRKYKKYLQAIKYKQKGGRRRKSLNLSEKRRIFIQHGGFIPQLIGIAASVAGSLFADFVKNKIQEYQSK